MPSVGQGSPPSWQQNQSNIAPDMLEAFVPQQSWQPSTSTTPQAQWQQAPSGPLGTQSQPLQWGQPPSGQLGTQSQQLQWGQYSPAQEQASGALGQQGQYSPSRDMQAQSAQGQSLLPVPYQGGNQLVDLSQATSMPIVPMQTIEQLLPSLPEMEGSVYVPPMYTKPRPIIPRYRAVSGFLSFILVLLLLCGGSFYFARTAGWLHNIALATGLRTPTSQQPTATPPISDPANAQQGPAHDIIPSATLTTNIDPATKLARQPQKIFGVNVPFYLAYSIHNPKKDGRVVVKWYTGGNLYRTIVSDQVVKAGSAVNGSTQMQISLPTSGKVEIYWSDAGGEQLAQTLFFAVR
jgi:hypothetical protein